MKGRMYMKKMNKALSLVLVLCMTFTLLATSALAATDFKFTYPTQALDLDGTAAAPITMTQRAASEIPLIFGVNVIGGDMFDGLRDLAGTQVNVNPDPYIWNYTYMYGDQARMTEPGEATLPYGTYHNYVPSTNGTTVNNGNGLYSSGGANQTYSQPQDELGGVGYAVGFRSDIIIGFTSALVDQIDLVNSWKPGDEFYQEGDETYSPLIIDVQTGSVTSRLYSWTEMGQAISAYLKEHTELKVRYGDPYATAVNVEGFSAGIPYYIASLIADGSITKKTAAYVSKVDMYTFTCVDPGTLGNVRADVYAEVNNLNFLSGSYTLDQLMEEDVDIIVLGASGYGYTDGGTGGQTGATTTSDKLSILSDLAKLGFSADDVPLVMDDKTTSVTPGSNGYNYAPTTPMFLPYVHAYAYMEELAAINPAINPAALVQFMLAELFHVTEDAASDVALYYIGTNWDSVDEDYDTVPNLVDYKYDKAAIISAIQKGISYALSGKAATNGNTLLPAMRTTDLAYTMLTTDAVSEKPADDHEYVTLTVDGKTKYLDLTALSDAETDGDPSGDEKFGKVRTTYQAVADYYDSGEYGYGDNLQQTLQKYADRMVAHVWKPDTSVQGTYGFGVGGTSDTGSTFSDVKDSEWYAEYVAYAYKNGLMNGITDTTFSPGTTLTRAQIAQVLYNIEGKPAATGSIPFTDASDHWAKDAITWAYNEEVVSGTSATTFSPEATATRQDVATMLYRYAVKKGYDVSSVKDITGFSDYSAVGEYARTALSWANAVGMITGDTETTLLPTGNTQRSQMSKIISEFHQKYA